MNKFHKISKEQYNKDIVWPIIDEYSSYGAELSPEGLKARCCDYDEYPLPKRGTQHSAAYDLESRIAYPLQPGEVKLIPTGIKCQLDPKFFLGLYIRSSMAYKHHLELVNKVGIVDADYYNNKDNEGHILLAVKNNGNEVFNIQPGNRLAQGIIQPYYIAEDDFEGITVRVGGFGSTENKEEK